MREIKPDSNYKVRKPTVDELEQLYEYFLSLGHDSESATNLINQYYYVVIDDYCSDCPAYSGRYLFAVYGCPEFYEVFIWNREGKIEQVEQESGMRKDIIKKSRNTNLEMKIVKNKNSVGLKINSEGLIENSIVGDVEVKYKVLDHTGENILTEEELIDWEKNTRKQSDGYSVRNDDGYEYWVKKVKE